jgi:phosphinothricin acetyltransferase
MDVRDATEEDLPGILAIYNDVIATSTAIYTESPVTLADRAEWMRARREQGYPVLVTEDETGITGYGSFGDFRAWPGYRHTVEHSVHVRADRRAHGIGAAIVAELLRRAASMRKHVMIAGIDADNIASLRLHERLGFEKVAHFREVGWKFGRWLDLVFLQRRL